MPENLRALTVKDDVYTLAQFEAHVAHATFIDYDGFGNPVKDGMIYQEITIKPSTFSYSLLESKGFTHICWYNR